MTALQARVADLSELERAALGFQEDPFQEGQWVAPDGGVFQGGHVVPLPRVIHDEQIVQLGPLTPVLATRHHKTGRMWKPQYLNVSADEAGEIELVSLTGPVLRRDERPYADGSRETWQWWVGYRFPMSAESDTWPNRAPDFAVAAVRWLIDSRPYLHLPDAG